MFFYVVLKEELINPSETIGGFRGAREDTVAPNGLCPLGL